MAASRPHVPSVEPEALGSALFLFREYLERTAGENPAADEDEEAGAGVNEPETRNEGGKQRLILFVGMSANFSCPCTEHQTERPVSKETSSILRRAK